MPDTVGILKYNIKILLEKIQLFDEISIFNDLKNNEIKNIKVMMNNPVLKLNSYDKFSYRFKDEERRITFPIELTVSNDITIKELDVEFKKY